MVPALLASACGSAPAPEPDGAASGLSLPDSAPVAPLGPTATARPAMITPWEPAKGPTASPTATGTPRPSATPRITATARATVTLTATLPATALTDAEAAVIGAVLRATTLAPGQRRLVLANRTVAPPLDEARAAELAAWEQPELVTAFRDRAAQVLPLPAKLNLPVTLSLAEGASLRAHDAAPNWATFQRAFPRANGYAEVSGVGFDPSGELALVYVAHTTGPGQGRGTLYLLEGGGGSWQVLDAEPLWVH
jgi:hypothetical protein